MSLSDLAALGSFVSGLAVVVTLIFLVLQMRQTDRNQRAAMQLGLASRANDMFTRMGDPEFARISIKVTECKEPLSEVEMSVWIFHVMSLLYSWESSYLHHRAGVLDDAMMETEEQAIRGCFVSPAFRAAWQLRPIGSAEFRRYIDSIATEVSPIQPTPWVPLYEGLLREQMSRAIPIPGDGAAAVAQIEAAMRGA